jgi:hypothetical protein
MVPDVSKGTVAFLEPLLPQSARVMYLEDGDEAFLYNSGKHIPRQPASDLSMITVCTILNDVASVGNQQLA